VFIWVLLKLGLDWEQAARRNFEDLLKKSDHKLDRTLLPASGQFTGGEPLLRRSDRTLELCSPCVRSEDDRASGQAKETKTGSTGLWLRSVSYDRTRPVMTRGVLDLSGVDRTLGGSVRSLSPECPVSRNREGSELSVSFPFLFL